MSTVSARMPAASASMSTSRSSSNRAPAWWRVETVLALFVATQVCAGVLRWILGKVGLAAAIYLPTVLLWVAVAAVAWRHLRRNDLSMGAIALGALLLLGVLVGALSLPMQQVAFGAWVLTPAICGYALGGRIDPAQPWARIFVALALIVACIGVFGDDAMRYPWIGANFELAGKEITGSRDWNIGEHRRLAGFSRSSFDAAGQIAVFAVVVNAHLRGRALRTLVWALSIAGVACTTARGVLVAMFVAMLVIESPNALRMFALRAFTAIGVLWMTLPPLLAWTVDFSQAARLQLKTSYGSYLDRMANMWPQALDLLTHAPAPPLGRGIGGIGAAQTLYEPDRFNAADNLLVYQGVALGVLALPPIFFLLVGLLRRAFHATPASLAMCTLALIVVWYGAVSNILEHPILALVFGVQLNLALASFRSPSALPRSTSP